MRDDQLPTGALTRKERRRLQAPTKIWYVSDLKDFSSDDYQVWDMIMHDPPPNFVNGSFGWRDIPAFTNYWFAWAYAQKLKAGLAKGQ